VGAAAKVWTFVTYSLLHANLTHLGFNVLWLLPFGSALARRFGALRFSLFMAVTAVAGALAHLVTHEHAVAPMIGASASVSGTMAAAIRFAFVKGSFLSFNRGDADAAA
jgi:membrane associated rhomboid family serine protease